MGRARVDGGGDTMTDTELLDVLQKLNDEAVYSGVCILRRSTTGRGWRLHETADETDRVPVTSVRQAIEDFVKLQEPNHEQR